MNRIAEIKENKNFDINTQENISKVVSLSLRIEDAVKQIVGKENYRLNIEDIRMMAMVALTFNYKS